jgi:hypothetical protein
VKVFCDGPTVAAGRPANIAIDIEPTVNSPLFYKVYVQDSTKELDSFVETSQGSFVSRRTWRPVKMVKPGTKKILVKAELWFGPHSVAIAGMESCSINVTSK